MDWGSVSPDPATGSAREWPRLFFYGGLAPFAQPEAPLGPDRLSERLLSARSGPPARLPGGGSATFPQLPVSGYLGPELYVELGTVGSAGIELIS